MKLTFKNGALFLTLGLTAIALQTACVNEAERLAAEKNCEVSDATYGVEFIDFYVYDKIVIRKVFNDKIIQEQMIDLKDPTPYGVGVDFSLMNTINQKYQIIINDRYLFTLSEVKVYAREFRNLGRYVFHCRVKELTINDKKRFNSDKNYNRIDKKDAIILPVANSKK